MLTRNAAPEIFLCDVVHDSYKCQWAPIASVTAEKEEPSKNEPIHRQDLVLRMEIVEAIHVLIMDLRLESRERRNLPRSPME